MNPINSVNEAKDRSSAEPTPVCYDLGIGWVEDERAGHILHFQLFDVEDTIVKFLVDQIILTPA